MVCEANIAANKQIVARGGETNSLKHTSYHRKSVFIAFLSNGSKEQFINKVPTAEICIGKEVSATLISIKSRFNYY